jgi:heat-inducible transcriptional repressor
VELTARKREILRRLVEEYVSTGQPVGSRTLVERSGVEASPSTVRNELSELEALGLLTHPHTSAGRVPTESGYRVYTEELVATIDGRPIPFPVSFTVMHGEVESALQQTTDALSQATRLLALVTAPAIATAVIRHVEVLQLQPRIVIVVVITATGGVTKRMFELEDPVDPGVVDWARAYLNESVSGLHLGAALIKRRFDDASLGASERRFLVVVRPVFVDVLNEQAPQLFVGGAAGLLDDARGGAELEAAQQLLGLLERRTAVLALLSDALDARRPVVRIGPHVDGTEIHDVSYVGATYGLANRSLGAVGLLGPVRMDYEKAIRTVRAAAFELSRLVEEVYESA